MSGGARQSQLMRQAEEYQGEYRRLSDQISNVTQSIEGYERQHLENQAVLKELGLLTDDASVYKQVGPCLIKQDMFEARSNVEKRIEYITKELERLNKQSENLIEKRSAVMQSFQKLQSSMPQPNSPSTHI
jgi:prefoldin beta subunit